MKIARQFFPKENSICSNYIFSYMSKEIFLIPKIKPQNVKNASQFLKNTTLGIFMVK